uniref:WGS project CAEQ00000000 data, annotated contig 2285 n=1 Tax=Trypanosoma congolense (strain IL3000) TaxID=1068625 RepID=F9WCW6_TRYCI|nr:unnamed protein product [Trypanosoma congolense IL3000]
MSAQTPLVSSDGWEGPADAQGPRQQRYGYVPVQMTKLVPVRVVSVRGDFFDMEIHQDMPLRVVQKAVEDCFKIRPELQLLTHNRQAINPNASLRRNGCLLLKGDPFVKLVLDVKKGPKLNIICQISNSEPIPIVCDGEDTIWDVKKKFCNAVGKPNVTPQRIKLMWRYWELNDKATVDYYHIPTNSKLTVMKKRDFPGTTRESEVPRRPSVRRRRRSKQPKEQRHDSNEDEVAAWGGGRTENTANDYCRDAFGDDTAAIVNENLDCYRPVDTSIGARAQGNMMGPTDRQSWAEPPNGQVGRAVIPLDMLSGESRCEKFPSEEPGDRNDVIAAGGSQLTDLAELHRLRMEVEALGRRMESCVSSQSDVGTLRESFRVAIARVGELEASVGRFQDLLKRALVLM